MTFNHYLTKAKSMLERNLLMMLDKNREIVLSFNHKRHKQPLFREFCNIYVNEFY